MKNLVYLLCLVTLFTFINGCSLISSTTEGTTRPVSITREKPVILWIDFSQSEKILTTEKKTNAFLKKAKQVGITHLGIETRNHHGEDIFNNQRSLMTLAQKHKLGIIALVPLFITPEDTDPQKLIHTARWDGKKYTVEPLHNATPFPKRLTPADKTVREHEIEYITRLAKNKDLEGIILLHCGFGSLLSDLGPVARENFENWTGSQFKNWPEDIIGKTPPNAPYSPEGRGPYWNKWMLWRTVTLRDFVLRLRGELEMTPVSPPPYLSVLVDAPFAVYQRQGLNWCKSGTQVETDMPWLPPGTDKTGCAHLVDSLVLGFWGPELSTPEEAEKAGYAWWASLSGAMTSARRYTEGETKLWGTIEIKQSDSSWGANALETRKQTEGLLILPASSFLMKPDNWGLLELVLKK